MHPVDGPSSQGYRADIDGLRAISILLVVGFHAGVSGLPGGYVGVDVFFVLSGYLITSLLVAEQRRTGRVALGQFVARRVRRLLPMSSLVLVVTLLAGVWLLPPLARESLVGDARAAALYVANWRFAGQATAYSDTEVTDSLLVHYWSLSIEEQFYVLWPLLILGVGWLVGRRRPDRVVPALGVAIGALVAASLWASVSLTERLGPQAYYLTHTRLWEIGVGAGLALAGPHLRRIPRRVAQSAAVVAFALLLAAATRLDEATAFPGWVALVPVLSCAVLVATAAQQPTVVSRALSWRPLVALGRLSYGWYLWHWPAIGLGLLFVERAGWSVAPGVVTALAVAASLGLAAACHVLVEHPVRHAAQLQGPARRSLALGGVLMAVPVLAGATALHLADRGDVAVAAASSGPQAMTPQEAAEDRPTVGAIDDCHSTIPETEVADDCVFGDPSGGTTVVLIGDSHAQQWLPAFHDAGLAEGWRVLSWTKAACPPIEVEVWNDRLERRYLECDDWRSQLFARLRAEGSVDLVVLASSYGYTRRTLDANGTRVGPNEVAPIWETAARRTFAELLAIAPRVVRLHDTPWAPHDVPTCLSSSPDDPTSCAFDTGRATGLDAILLAAEAAAAPAGVSFVDLNAAVCPTPRCEVVTPDGVIKYRDSHHLGQTFARSLAPEVAQFVRAALR
jgi:peptidoglycan/LPS O-acetylase OafA/YrhL